MQKPDKKVHDPHDSVVLHIRCKVFEKRKWESAAASGGCGELSDWIRDSLDAASRDTLVLPCVKDGRLGAEELAETMRTDCRVGLAALAHIRRTISAVEVSDALASDLVAISAVLRNIKARFGGE